MTTRRGMGRIYQRGATYWIQFCFRGQVYRESAKSTKEADAIRLLKQRIGEMGQGRTPALSAEKVTFANLAQLIRDDYAVNRRKSTRRLETALHHLAARFGCYRAVDITADHVMRYLVDRRTAGASDSSLQKETAALKRMFVLALKAKQLVERPYIPTITPNNTREGFFEAGEFRAVLAHLPDAVRPVVQFAYLTGWRKGEILSLQWRQVDFEGGVVRLDPGTTKNNEGRTFPFAAHPGLAALLRHQHDERFRLAQRTGALGPWVFCWPNGSPIKDIRSAWATACKRAGVPGRLFHDLRRTAVRNLERASVPRSVAMKLTGHKTEAVYRRYAIASEADLAEAVGRLAQRTGTILTQSPVVPVPVGATDAR